MSEIARILFIDDDPDLRAVLGTRLKAEGFEVTTAGSGKEGLGLLKDQSFHLILLDMIMPDQDGVETYQAIRATPATRQTPVILLTGMAVESHWEALPYETDGPCFVMGKPNNIALLISRITQLLAEVRGN
jgi:CheY-like chemotaxis protein